MKFILIIVLMASAFPANSVGIIFSAQECANQDDPLDMSTTGALISSAITVTKANKDNTFDLIITGGMPRLSSHANEVCIEKKYAFGHTADTDTRIDPTPFNPISTPTPLESITGVAWFNGDDLVVSLTAMVFGLGPIINDAEVSSSVILPINTILILNHNEIDGSFKLISFIKSTGGSGSDINTNQGLYADVIFPISSRHVEVLADVVYKIIE